jgi:hypothetical protein
MPAAKWILSVKPFLYRLGTDGSTQTAQQYQVKAGEESQNHVVSGITVRIGDRFRHLHVRLTFVCIYYHPWSPRGNN